MQRGTPSAVAPCYCPEMDKAARIAELKRKRAAREGTSEYAENVKAIDAEIARLEG